MFRRFASVALAALLFAPAALAVGTRTADHADLIRALNGSPTFLGCIAATTSAKNNADSTAFTITAGSLLLIVPTAAVKILPDTNATEDVTTTTGIPLAALEKFYLLMKSDQTYLQAITDSSTSTVCVWRLE